jgi:predicted transcriptional regulator of viral defense system
MAKQLNWHLVANELRKNNITVFSPQDLQHLFGASEIALRFLLTRAVKRGDALKFRRGLYGLTAHTPSELEIANLLYRPSYISFTFALSYYHIIPEMVYPITSATTRTTATFTVLEKQFVYHRIKRAAFTGYAAERVDNRTVWIAEPEKALVDMLYFVALKKQGLPERIDLARLSKQKMRAFAKLFDYPDVERNLEELLCLPLTRSRKSQSHSKRLN